MKQLHLGDCMEVIRSIESNSIDSVVTDPPYELGFMGKSWDSTGIAYNVDLWREVLRVLKPGGHLLSFGGTRTAHRMTCAIEDAGFQIRDMVAWVYGSGFPKSLDVSKAIDKAAGHARATEYEPNYANATFGKGLGGGKHGAISEPPVTPAAQQWQGFGTALKPALEPVTLARKPLIGTVALNVMEHGTGALNIDGCRVGTESTRVKRPPGSLGRMNDDGWQPREGFNGSELGRWPANLIHDGSDEVVGLFPQQDGRVGMRQHGSGTNSVYGKFDRTDMSVGNGGVKDTGSAARFFYCAKASKRDRDEGLSGHYWLDSLELVFHLNGEDVVVLGENLWVLEGQNQKLQQDGEVSQEKDMSGDTILCLDARDLNIALSGKDTTALFPKAIRFTTSTAIKTTIELKTLNYYSRLTISESIQDVIKTNQENGLSLAENAGLKSLLKAIFTKDEMEFPLGVRLVAKSMQQKISAKEKLLKMRNIHSTVKPTDLMRYLCRLITPPGGVVLDPFMGSGSTGKAAILEGFQFIGIEQNAEYYAIAERRIP